MQGTDVADARGEAAGQDASALERLFGELEHAHRVIAFLVMGAPTPSVAIPYRMLDDLPRNSVLVRRHTDNNDVVHYQVLERAQIVPLGAESRVGGSR